MQRVWRYGSAQVMRGVPLPTLLAVRQKGCHSGAHTLQQPLHCRGGAGVGMSILSGTGHAWGSQFLQMCRNEHDAACTQLSLS